MITIINLAKRIYRLFNYYLNIIYVNYLFRMSKWLVHKISGKSELERICLATECSAIKFRKIGKNHFILYDL